MDSSSFIRSTQESIQKLKKSCAKQNKEAAQHYINHLSLQSQKYPQKSTLLFKEINTAFLQSSTEDLYYKISLLRIFEQSDLGMLKIVGGHFGCIMDVLLFMDEEREFSGSSSVVGYFGDCRRLICGFKRAFEIDNVKEIELELIEREQKAAERSAKRSECMKRIEEDREKHKKVRERAWFRIYETTEAPMFIDTDAKEHQADFEDAWDRVEEWNDTDDLYAQLQREYFNVK